MENLQFKKPEFDWKKQELEFKAHVLQGCHFKMHIPLLDKNPKWYLVEETRDDSLLVSGPKHSNIIKNKNIEIDFSFPESGVYNYKGTVIKFSRLFSRQWKRGIYEGNSRFKNWMDDNESIPREIYNANIFSITPQDLTLLFESRKPNFKQAFQQITEKDVFARSVSSHIFLSCGIKDDRPIVWFDGVPVGVVEDEKTVSIKVPIFDQEVRDLLRKEDLHFLSKKGKVVENDEVGGI